jgi:transcriptional regulator with XRE-family HTH domain
MTFGENLASVRKRAGKSQEALAEELGVSRQSVYTWEADIASPSIVMAESIAKILGVSIGELVEGGMIDRLPKILPEYSLVQTRVFPKTILVEELPGWLIVPKKGEEVVWANYLAKKGEMTSAYHVKVSGPAKIHEQDGVEIRIEEYSPEGNLLKDKTKVFYAQINQGKTRYLALESKEGDVHRFQDYRDSSFRKFWGGNEATSLVSTGSFELTLLGKTISLERLPLYLEGDLLIDQYVNEQGKTVLWKRYNRQMTSKDCLDNNGVAYGLEYQILTSHFWGI